MENIVFYSYLAFFPLFMILGGLLQRDYYRPLWHELTQNHGIFLPTSINNSHLLAYLHKEEKATIKEYIRQDPYLLELYRRAHWGYLLFTIGGFPLSLMGLPLTISVIYRVATTTDTLLIGAIFSSLKMLRKFYIIFLLAMIIGETVNRNNLYAYRQYQRQKGVREEDLIYHFPLSKHQKNLYREAFAQDATLKTIEEKGIFWGTAWGIAWGLFSFLVIIVL